MSGFRFADVQWIHLLWPVAGLAIALVVLERRGRLSLDRFLSPRMQLRLVQRASGLRRLASILFLSGALALLVFAMMRPQWGTVLQRTVRVDSQIMICLDVSKSMLAEDVAPSRLRRAKIELDSLLGLMDDGQQVGLTAFAGKATVMCPMTTDFGFLRLILNEVQPSSVGRGGTKIGEAINKAVDGFRAAGDINRLILLVTDGEDHDSYPLQAAQRAREKGIRVVSIGFGDEMGSKIEITDPETRTRSVVRDRNGNPVITRLDGETLRKIALETDGAYVPAGTGALDLESIYRAHIASLLQGSTDSQQRVVRNEAYQWLVLGALLLLLIGLFVRTPLGLKAAALAQAQQPLVSEASRAAIWLAAVAFALSPAPRAAAQQPAATGGTAPQVAGEQRAADTNKTGADPAADEELVPREAYNRALALLSRDPDRAEKYLNRARRDAGSDGELRYRTLYNLGWVEVNRANRQLEDDPEQALRHLIQAANRFREAVRVRPDSTDARHNLEVVSLRILELTDALKQRDPRDLAARLDELIQQLRQQQAELQGITEQTVAEQGAAQLERWRKDFRRLGVAQRGVISELQRFVDDARQEVDALQQKPESERTAEEALRTGQLANMLEFLDGALQRLNQSRSLTRRMQGPRAFRRWAAGLADAKRARDQLRNPVEILGVVIADASEMLDLTRALAAARTRLPQADREIPAAPPWLTRDYLQDRQASILDRTGELAEIFAQTVAARQRNAVAGPAAPGAPPPGQNAQANDPRTRQLLDNIEQALPFIRQAVEHFRDAAQQLADGTLSEAAQHQTQAVAALAEAWEWFFDIRRLIEVIHRDEQVIRQAIENVPPEEEVAREVAVALEKAQQKNLARAERLGKLLQFEIEQLQQTAKAPTSPAKPAPKSPPTPQPTDEQRQARLQQFELASSLLAQVVDSLQQSLVPIGAVASGQQAPEPAQPAGSDPADQPPADSESGTEAAGDAPTAAGADPPPERQAKTEAATTEPRDPRWQQAAAAVDSALSSLQELRRLFFSLVEHLRDTAQRQADLNDDTSRLAGEPPASQTAAKRGPLAARQTQLQQIARQIADALSQQSQQAAAQPRPGSAQAGASPDGADTARTLSEAADLVVAAHGAMDRAADHLRQPDEDAPAESKPLPSAREEQDVALQKLAEALALLDKSQRPPNQPQQPNQQDQQQKQQQEQRAQDQQQQQRLTAQQLLQLIRDREAQRRKSKRERGVAPDATVEKDW